MIDLTKILTPGDIIYTPLAGPVKVTSVNSYGQYCIMVEALSCTDPYTVLHFTRHGIFNTKYPNAKPLRFPSQNSTNWTLFSLTKKIKNVL